MSDSEEKQLPSNSSDISIEELGPENEGPAKNDDAEELLAHDALDDVSVGGRLEELPQEEVKKDSDRNAEPEIPPPAVAPAAAKVEARRSMLEESDEEDESEDEEEDEDDFDETLLERLVGLTEMFPDSVRRGSCALARNSVSFAKWTYSVSRTVSWIAFSSSVVLFLPIMIETERMGIEEAQKQQQRQILLGPGAAMSAGANAPLPAMR